MRPGVEQRGCGFFFTAAVVLLVCLCGTAMAPQAQARPSRIGIALPSYRENRWAYDLESLQAEAETRHIDILVRFAGNDQKYQNLQIREMLNIGIDALIIIPNDAVLAAEGVAAARARSVPVVAYDRLATGCTLDAYVTFDQFHVGELQGRFLAERMPRGKYILISGPATDSNAPLFWNGAMKCLQPLIDKGDISVVGQGVATQWRADVARGIVKEILAREPSIDAVLSPGDDVSGGILEALKEKGLAGKVLLTGQDATPAGLERIRQGMQGMTVFKDSGRLAPVAMAAALGLIAGSPVPSDAVTENGGGKPVPTYIVPVSFIDAQSLDLVRRNSAP